MDRIEEWKKKRTQLYYELEALYHTFLSECDLTGDVIRTSTGQRGKIKVQLTTWDGECNYIFYPYKKDGQLSKKGVSTCVLQMSEKWIKEDLQRYYCKADDNKEKEEK